MKQFILYVVALVTIGVGVFILIVSWRMVGNPDPAALTRYETVMKTAMIPSLTALLTFLAGTGVFKGILIAIDNAQRLANGKPPEKIELFI